MEKQPSYLDFTIKLLDILNMWPVTNNYSFVRRHYIIIMIALSTFPLKADAILAYIDGQLIFTNLVESLIAVCALYSVIYCSICFMIKKGEIKLLVEELQIFEQYTPMALITETEETVTFYTKCFIVYGIIGNIFYALSPFLSYKSCMSDKSEHMIKYGISCGLIARYVLPFKYDYSPVSQIVMVEEFFTCTLGTIIIMTITMLLSGILKHCTTHLQYLKSLILKTSSVEKERMQEHVNYCVKFHTIIIEYTDKMNNSFSSMMLLHICGTSFIISVLGFAILMEENYSNSVRFVMHLAGWFGMLFVVCYYGQTLMDKSSDISIAAYDTLWYEAPFKVRESICLILLRSQRPLTLKAAGVNMMSFATFLGILSTSYSYFTLLLKIKP